MKAEMREILARQSFEDKIRKVGQLIQLSRKVKVQRAREDAPDYPQSASHIEFTRRGGPKNSKK